MKLIELRASIMKMSQYVVFFGYNLGTSGEKRKSPDTLHASPGFFFQE